MKQLTQTEMAQRIERRLITDLWDKGIVLPRFAPKSWWECDLCVLTKSGYFREYEIKTSMKDFLKDSKKSMNGKNKHDMLQARSEVGPTAFFFAMPSELADIVVNKYLVPEWAGLIGFEFFEGDFKIGALKYTYRQAPILHQKKAPRGFKLTMLKNSYYRLHEQRRRIIEITEGREEYFDDGTGI